MKYTMYTDGGCAVNPGGAGGAACVIIDENGKIREMSEGYVASTNNRMELSAVIMGLMSLPIRSDIQIYSDSQYTVNCANGEWQKRKNKDLWDKFDIACRQKIVRIDWVRGHAGNEFNERCDELCTLAMTSPKKHDRAFENNNFIYSNEFQTQRNNGDAMSRNIEMSEHFKDKNTQEANWECDAKNYAQNHNISKKCAESILALANANNPSFTDYYKLKTDGRDHWSNVKDIEKELKQYDDEQTDQILEMIKSNLATPSNQKKAARWYLRGLPLELAIRKVYVDDEVSHLNAQSKYKGK